MVTLPAGCQSVCLEQEQLVPLHQMYNSLYPLEDLCQDDIAVSYRCYANIRLGPEHHGSKLYHMSDKMSAIMAAWTTDDGHVISECTLVSSDIRPGRVRFFMEHNVKIDGEHVSHVLACIQWFEKSDNTK